jgi:hypothetical protein
LYALCKDLGTRISDRAHLDMGSPFAPPDTSPPSTRAARHRSGDPHRTRSDGARGPQGGGRCASQSVIDHSCS